MFLENYLILQFKLYGSINKNAGEKVLDVNNKISEPIKQLNQNLAEEGENYGEITRTAGQVGQVVGNMVPSIVTSAITKSPALSLTTMGLSAKGQSTQEALDKGATLDEAVKIGDTKAMIEVGTEMLTGGINIFGKGALDDIVQKGIDKKVKNEVANFLLKKGVDISGEILEETISDVLDTAIDKGTVDPEAKYSLKDWSETALITTLSTLVLSGISGGYSKQAYLDNSQNLNTNNQSNTSTQQIMPVENNIAQNQNMEQINSVENVETLPTANYQYQKSENIKIDNLRQDAGRFFNNSEQANNYIKMLEQIIADKDIEIRLNANLQTTDGKIINGSYSDGVITINPNSTRTGEFIAIHELTHAIGTEQMKNIINNYRQTNSEFNSAVSELLKNYNSTEINEEALADVSAQLFGNQEFINNLAQSNPNLFQKIYNEIKYLWHQFTGYKNQDQFINDLKYKWEQAYRNNNNLNNTTSFSIQTNSDGSKYVQVDTDQDIFEGKSVKEQTKIAQEYILNNFREKGLLKDENKIKVTRKTANEYTHPKNGMDNATYSSKMKASTELDNLLEISKFIKSETDDGRHVFAKDGWDYYETVFKVGNKTYSGWLNIAKGENGKLLYDITNIKERASNYSVKTVSVANSSINNSITPDNQNVNTNIKYSIQESENNSGSFSLTENKRFDVTENENLNNASTLFFRTREDGIYYVQATNASGNITYDGTFIDKRSLEKTLGTEIAEYIVKNSETINNEIYLESNKVDNKTDYMMRHRPSEEYGNASNFESNMDGVFEHPEWYMNMQEDYNLESLKALRKVRKKPDAEITIYRATPGNEINFGDWVTPSKKYAEFHNNSQLNGKGNILKLKAKAKDILWGGDDINEFGYFPNNSKYSQNNQTWQTFLEANFKSTGTRTNLSDIVLPKANTNILDNISNKELSQILSNDDLNVLNELYEKEGKAEILTEKKKAKLLEKYVNDKYKFKESIDILAQKIVNKGHYIDKLSESAKNPELKFIYDKSLNSFAEGQYSIGVAQTDNSGKVIGKSINDIWKPVEENNLTKEFSEYLLHKHNIDRSGKNKYVFGEEIGPTESTAIALDLEQKHPEFKKYAEDIKKFNHNNLENMKKAGLINQEAIDYMESMYPNYIPISRDIENNIYTGNNDKTGTKSPIKKATGGNSDIQPIKDTMAQQVIRIKKLVNQNNLGKELAKTLKNAKVEEGFDIELTPALLFEIDTMVETDSKGNKYYTYYEDGKQQKLKIDDKLYESLVPTEIGKWENTLPMKAVQKVTSIHRNLLTSSNPLFVVTNFFKDFQDGMFNSKYSSKFIKNYGKALNEIVTKGDYYQSYMANGGMTNTYFDYNEGIKKQSNKFVEKIRNVNEIVEQLPRLSEFISTLEDGKSLNEALYNSAEITTNFKRGGDITKAINRNGANFLNASIQGLDKQFRNLKGQNGVKGYVNLLAKATIMSIAPSVLNHMLLDDDEDYQDLPQSTKDLYYLFKYDDGKFIRIPKGRVLSIFGAVARRTIESIQGQDDAWSGFKDTIVNQIAPNNPIEDNILSPISQIKNNKTWYGSDLVSSRLQQELPKNQYDETTDEFSKWLGNKLNISPKKINYALDQYSGAIGDILLPIITPQAKQNVVLDKFTTDSVLKNKNVSKFYETLEKQTQIANDSFATDEDEIKVKYLNGISKSMSDLYKEKRNIQMSDISNKEKTKKVREIQEKINNLAEEGLANYNNTVQKSNYSKVGDEEYYKNSSGEWTKVSAEEKEKMGNISLETYSDYKQKIYTEKNKKVTSGELKKSQDLKDKDKLKILINSNYSSKEKQELYENYILGKDDTKYSIIKETFTSKGLNINKYLEYKSQEFESTKKDDGTVKGKTVSGSKKEKVLNYINSIEGATYTQKLILSALEYEPSKDSDKQLIVNYVKNLNKTEKEKLEILGTFKGITIYKNGSYKW